MFVSAFKFIQFGSWFENLLSATAVFHKHYLNLLVFIVLIAFAEAAVYHRKECISV